MKNKPSRFSPPVKTVEAVIFDWAGTTVDYGCFAPVNAFVHAFEAAGLTPTVEETRAPMGLPKRDHVAAMLESPRLHAAFVKQYGREPDGVDVDTIYKNFEPALLRTLHNYATPLPYAVETVEWLREREIKIGSTTGYTAAMMAVIAPLAQRSGYQPDCMVCPDNVGVGRPAPYMLWQNLKSLHVKDIRAVLKVGDTLADIEEGKRAGCLTVGLLLGSSLLGLAREEVEGMSCVELSAKMHLAKQQYLAAGADFVLDSMRELPGLIKDLQCEKQGGIAV